MNVRGMVIDPNPTPIEFDMSPYPNAGDKPVRTFERHDPVTGETRTVPPPYRPDPFLIDGPPRQLARYRARLIDQNRLLDALTDDDMAWLYAHGWDGTMP